MKTRHPWINDFLLAGVFLTRLPFAGFLPSDPAPAGSLERAVRAFPLVGALLAVLGGIIFWLTSGLFHLPPLVAALITLSVLVVATGGLHEDGLADVADGFGGGWDKARKLAIMKDSLLGSYGVLSLILLVGIKAAALAALEDPVSVFGALLAALTLSRALPFLLMQNMKPARSDGLGAGFSPPPVKAVLTALLLAFLLSWLGLGFFTALTSAVAALLVGWLFTLLARQQIGGYTGDVIGALIQLTEVAVLVAASAQ
ncbi:adenosylcobinamide-GDP ribazoletransferase [Rhodovibrionaceae bacterium A322]